MTPDELKELRDWSARVCGRELPDNWFPDVNIAQAIEVMDKVRNGLAYDIGQHEGDEDHYCLVMDKDWTYQKHESREIAILLASRLAHIGLQK
jgi:hypothetical protein